jgi:hypothetical protein
MARNQLSQPQRTQNNPLNLGTFSQTSLRYLKGSLGPKNQVVGRADTAQQSNGGFGGGAYNHWFQVKLSNPAWIIVRKGPPRPQYIQISAYDLNRNPIQGNPVFDADSVTVDSNGDAYIPYLDTVMSTQSDLYNQFSSVRLDKGDERYYPLSKGSYLLCISTTRNEPLDYEVGLVVEFPITEQFFALEDFELCLQETEIDSTVITGPILSDLTLNTNAFTQDFCEIASGVTVTISSNVTWFIGYQILPGDFDDYRIILEPGNEEYFDTIHDHSLSEWKEAWESTHQDTDKFPELFVPLVNRP